MGSSSELEYEILLARDLGFLSPDEHDQLTEKISEIKRMLASYHQKLTADSLAWPAEAGPRSSLWLWPPATPGHPWLNDD